MDFNKQNSKERDLLAIERERSSLNEKQIVSFDNRKRMLDNPNYFQKSSSFSNKPQITDSEGRQANLKSYQSSKHTFDEKIAL